VLDAYWGRLNKVYGTSSIAATAALALDDGLELAALKAAQVNDLEAWIAAVLQPVKEAIA
jgi:hypothetical protein